MNTFKHKFYIDEKPYTVFVDSSNNEYKRIVINNKEVVNEKYTLSLNRSAYIIYYPIKIGNDELVISIDDNSIIHEYNIYLNGISLTDESRLDEKYKSAQEAIEMGFLEFSKRNWIKVLKNYLIEFIIALISVSLLCAYTLKKIILFFLLIILIIPLAIPLFLVVDWFDNKKIIRKYQSCFRPKVEF